MFESLLAHASKHSTDEWSPKLANEIYLENGRDRHGWRIYKKNLTRERITEYLQKLVDRYQLILSISPAKEEDNFVFVDIVDNYDLIDGGALLLEYLNALPSD